MDSPAPSPAASGPRDAGGEPPGTQQAPPPPRRPRVWTAILAGLLAVPVALAFQAVAALVCILVTVDLEQLRAGENVEDTIAALLDTPPGFLVVLVPGQVAMALLAIVAAGSSSAPLRDRLRLHAGRARASTYALLMLGSPLMLAVCGVLWQALHAVGLFPEPSEHLEALGGVFAGAAGGTAALLVLAASVLPALAEELLFRGYVQSRLVQRWGPLAGITVASLMFAAVHVDPQHAITVLPLGFWIGYVAWRTGSVWPAAACHFAVNAAGLGLAAAGTDAEADGPAALVLIALAALVLVAFIGAVVALERSARAAATEPHRRGSTT